MEAFPGKMSWEELCQLDPSDDKLAYPLPGSPIKVAKNPFGVELEKIGVLGKIRVSIEV